jgi:predicted GNAT family N-acyltransferase
MSDDPFFVEPAHWHVEADQQALRHVRGLVFEREQGVSREDEWDDLDPHCAHALARDAHGRPIGTGRLTPEHKIGRMAVLPEWRGNGVGRALLLALIERARERGWPQVDLHAQVEAIGFYQRHGFIAHGEEFVEAGIRHRHMWLALSAATQVLVTRDRAEVKAALLQLLDAARHAVAVHSRDLDPGLLDDEDVVLALQRVAGSGRGAALRCLLHDPARAMRDGHRLLALAQRLPTAVQMRVPVEDDDRAYAAAFVLNDAGGYLLRPLAGRFEGRGSTQGRGEHRALLRYFDQVWERARRATELRPLGL